MPRLLALLLPTLALAAAPADLAPGAPELQADQRTVEDLLRTNAAVATATARLQELWAFPPPPEPAPDAAPNAAAPNAAAPKKPSTRPEDPSKNVVPLTRVTPAPKDACADTAHLAVGWHIERFGAAWRETAQAVRAAADRLARTRAAPTVSPLVDAPWAATLDGLTARADEAVRTFREASAWQARFVRPVIQACPAPSLVAAPGLDSPTVLARGESRPPVAVLALGDGVVCPDGARADDAVVLLQGASACWSAAAPCACTPAPVAPGAVLAPP